MDNKFKTIFIILLALLIAIGAFYLRMRAVDMLPVDYDEDDYIRAGQLYAADMREGNLSGIMNQAYNQEHPALAKLFYGAVLLSMPPAPLVAERHVTSAPAAFLPQPQGRNLRISQAVLGSLEVLFLSLVNPLAGVFLAIHTFTIKYTSQIMLEALPAFLSLLSVLTYLRSKGRFSAWLVFSGILLGFAAASKYIYAAAGIAIAIHFLFFADTEYGERRFWKRFGWVTLWGVIALVAFFAADPYLWPDPINRLQTSLLFNVNYSQSAGVVAAGFPWWQPFIWLSESVPWHPGVFLLGLDMFTAIFAVIGLIPLAHKRSIYFIWLIVGLVFLLVWPTKWPQYILILSAPFCMAAAEGFITAFVHPIQDWVKNPEGKPRFH